MAGFLIKRGIFMVITMFVVSIIAFVVIQLPPGDYITTMINEMQAQGDVVSSELEEALRVRYGLGQPVYVQYYNWISGIIKRLDFGWSFTYIKPVSEIIWDRLLLTTAVGFSALLFSWILALPIGIFSAVKQYSLFDYIFTFIGFIGLATPNFLLALIILYIGYRYFGINASGLFSPEFKGVPWSWPRVLDLLTHIWVPMIVVGTARTAGLIRIMRANMLDELNKPYVNTARMKGLSNIIMIIKYPVRIAINPFISALAWNIPTIISGVAITGIVLNLPTLGPMLLYSLQNQDMYLAGTIILLVSFLTVIGTLISDILLALADPRIRYE